MGDRATRKISAKVDQLAVDRAGHLVLLELKDAEASEGSVYFSPLQLLQYVHEWSVALHDVKRSLAKLVEKRVALGMSPPDIPQLVGEVRPVVAFGADVRSPEVRRRFEVVRAVVNRHRPTGASPVEVWAMKNGMPERVE